MNDVPSYIEFTPLDFESDIEHDPPSCAEDSSFRDDASSFAEQKIEVIKPSQKDVDAPYHNKMPAHMTSHPDDESQQDLDAMHWITIRFVIKIGCTVKSAHPSSNMTI